MGVTRSFNPMASTACFRWRPRFRVSALFWMTAVVAAFFCGRRYDGIQASANRWWQVTRVRLGAEVDPEYQIIGWPIGSYTINQSFPIRNIRIDNPTVASASLTSSRQLRIAPQANGRATISYSVPRQKRSNHTFEVEIDNGRIVDWTSTAR